MYIKKRYILITMVLIVSLLIPTVINAAEEYLKTIEVGVNTVNVTANGQPVEVDNFLYNGTTYIPLRAVSEQLGAIVDWEDETKTASITMLKRDIFASLDILHGFKFLVSTCHEITELKCYLETILYNNVTPYSNEHTLALLEDIKSMFDDKYKIYNDNLYVVKTNFIINDSEIVTAWAKCMENAFYHVAVAISALGLQAEAENMNDEDLFYSCDSMVYECIDNINIYVYNAEYIANQNYTAYRMSIGYDGLLDRMLARYEYLNDEIYLNTINAIDNLKQFDYTTIEIYTPKFNASKPNQSEYIPVIDPIVIDNTYTPITKPEQTIIIVEDKLKDNEYTFPLHLYSNDGKTYLGKCVIDDMDKDGIYYKFFGDYSSDFSQTSIWNDFSPYGGTIGNESAFNTIAQKPPKIVDNNGKFVAYLSVNKLITPRWTIEELRQFLVNNNQ